MNYISETSLIWILRIKNLIQNNAQTNKSLYQNAFGRWFMVQRTLTLGSCSDGRSFSVENTLWSEFYDEYKNTISTTHFETSNIIIVINKAEYANRGQMQYSWRNFVVVLIYVLFDNIFKLGQLIGNIDIFRMNFNLDTKWILCDICICWDKNL